MDEEKIKSSTEPDSLHLVHWDHYYSKIPSKNSGGISQIYGYNVIFIIQSRTSKVNKDK